MSTIRCIKLGVVVAITLFSSESYAATSTAGTYRVLQSWPLGIHDTISQMFSEDEPLCRALALAANNTYGHKAFDLNSDKLPTNGELRFAVWEEIPPTDAVGIAKKMLLTRWNATYSKPIPARSAELSELGSALSSGALRLDSTSAENYGDRKGVTRFVRLLRNSNYNPGQSSYIDDQLAIAEGKGFDHLMPLIGIEPAQDVISYRGISYLFGFSQRFNDNKFRVIAPPQPLLNLFEGTNGGYGDICKVIFEKRKRH